MGQCMAAKFCPAFVQIDSQRALAEVVLHCSRPVQRWLFVLAGFEPLDWLKRIALPTWSFWSFWCVANICENQFKGDSSEWAWARLLLIARCTPEICTCAHVAFCVYRIPDTHTCIHACMHACTREHTYVCIHTYMLNNPSLGKSVPVSLLACQGHTHIHAKHAYLYSGKWGLWAKQVGRQP